MNRVSAIHKLLATSVVVCLSIKVQAEDYLAKTHLWTVHNQGNIQTILDNRGAVGDQGYFADYVEDPLTGNPFRNTTYPRNSTSEWILLMQTMVGGVVNHDTIVSNWALYPDEPPGNQFRYESIDLESPIYSPQAHSEFDIICSYNDSIYSATNPPHLPLSVRVVQRSMAWSASNIDDFIMFDLEITNIGRKVINRGFIGFWSELMVKRSTRGIEDRGLSNVTGSLDAFPNVSSCDVPDTQCVYYNINLDGMPSDGAWNDESLLSTLGYIFLGSSATDTYQSFTWLTGVPGSFTATFRPLRSSDVTLLNSLTDERWWYYWLSYGKIAYDQLFTAIDHSSRGWRPPPQQAALIPEEFWHTVTLGIGPFDIGPGQKTHVTYAIVGGENVHVNPTDFATLWDPYNPQVYYNSLDFTDLMTNARWAKWVYDNPGVDTDGDGYFGKFRVCDGDTNWYEGDGYTAPH